MAGIINWFPLFSGTSINPFWLISQFSIIFLGVNITFFPQHFLGLNGIPRRYSDYPDSFITWNIISSIGRYTSLIAVIFFSYIIWEAIASTRPVVYNLTNSSFIEWLNSNPPSDHSYSQLNLIYYF
jgi:cytochrome c oxidase subunit 1